MFLTAKYRVLYLIENSIKSVFSDLTISYSLFLPRSKNHILSIRAMQNPKVSILIPVRNTSPFLVECLQSILDQSYRNWEVIAIDDHSTDNSKDLIARFAKKDDRIKIHSNNGKGIIQALHTAYGYAKGTLISRMDSDDIMFPKRLGLMVRSLEQHGIGHLSLGQVKYFAEEGIGNGYARYESWLNTLTESGINFSEIYKECVIPSPCWMVHREDLDRCGAFDSDRYPEDYDLAFRFYENKLICIPCDEVLHHWRDYDFRTSRTSEVYAQNYFLDIKIHYFLKLEYQKNRPLMVWGAGNKGKIIAKRLLERGISFYWVCDNPNKIGKEIYQQKMHHYTISETLENPQCIITVANSEAQEFIGSYLRNIQLFPMRDHFFFC